MPNKTIYIPDEDVPTWDEARRMLPFYQRKSISAFVMEKVREYVAEECDPHKPDSQRLNIEGDWKAAVGKALQKKRPKDGWPKPNRDEKTP